MRSYYFILMLLIVPFMLAVGAGAAAAEDITAETVKTRPLIQNRKTPVILHLEHKGGFPVMLEELTGFSGHPIHVMLVDPALNDYHHKLPQAMNVPGQYIFTMTPDTACGYRAWAKIKPENGPVQFARADVKGRENCKNAPIERMTSLKYQKGPYHFELSFDTGGLTAGTETIAKLTVRNSKGNYIDDLQPFMGAFGDIFGVHDNYKSIVDARPADEAPTSVTDRGGPILRFHITPARGGFMKLFAQVKINGNVITAPFGAFANGSMYESWKEEGDWREEEDNFEQSRQEEHEKRADEIDRMMAEETMQIKADEEKQKKLQEAEQQKQERLYNLFDNEIGDGDVSIYEEEGGNERSPNDDADSNTGYQEESDRLVPVNPF